MSLRSCGLLACSLNAAIPEIVIALDVHRQKVFVVRPGGIFRQRNILHRVIIGFALVNLLLNRGGEILQVSELVAGIVLGAGLLAARAGMASVVLIPHDLEEPKVLATGIYGTNLVAVRGNYDDVSRLCTELSAEHDWAFVNINMRPYYAEGSKPLAFEIAEQLNFELPDRIVVPIASGSLFTKIARGFDEWIEAGLLSGQAPVFNGAQADGCSPVATAFQDGQDFCRPVKPNTIV